MTNRFDALHYFLCVHEGGWWVEGVEGSSNDLMYVCNSTYVYVLFLSECVCVCDLYLVYWHTSPLLFVFGVFV